MTASTDRWPMSNWLHSRCPECRAVSTIAEATRARYGDSARMPAPERLEGQCPRGHTYRLARHYAGGTGDALHAVGACACCAHLREALP